MTKPQMADTCCKRAPSVHVDTRSGDTIIACNKCGRTVELLGTFRAVRRWNAQLRASRKGDSPHA